MPSLSDTLRTRVRDVTHDEGGFTLLEVLVSFVIFAVVAGSATVAIVSALQASHGSQQRVEAASVAQKEISEAQNVLTARPEDQRPYTRSVANEQFAVIRTIAFTPSSATQCPITPGAAPVTYSVSVTVSQQQTGRFLARSDTVVTC